MSKTPAGTVYNKTNVKLSSMNVTSNNVTSNTTYDPEDELKKMPIATLELNREKIMKKENLTTTTSTNITAEPLQLATSRSMNTDLIGDNHITLLGPLVTGSRTSPIVVRGKLIEKIPHPSNHQANNGVTVVDNNDENDDNEANIIVDADVYHVNNRYKIYAECDLKFKFPYRCG